MRETPAQRASRARAEQRLARERARRTAAELQANRVRLASASPTRGSTRSASGLARVAEIEKRRSASARAAWLARPGARDLALARRIADGNRMEIRGGGEAMVRR